MNLKRWMVAGALATSACATAPTFADEPVVWFADDQRDIEEPEEWKFVRPAYWIHVYGTRRITRVTEVRGKTQAHNVNALDEVPNSTWFTNRIGVRRVAAAEAVHASSGSGPPQLPLTAISGKQGGTRPGFIARDAEGRRFLVKFDFMANPHQQTGTGVIANRIFWTLGFNVPSEFWVDVERDRDVVAADDATVKDEFGRKRTMTDDDLDAMFATAPVHPDGRYRIFVSELLDGTPIGGARAEGTRKDDANDTVPHEHRRELRGMRVFAAWLGHTDIKEDNTLDIYVEESGRRFVRHYLVDLNECFGTHQSNMGRLEDGWEYNVDWQMQLAALGSLGIWKRPWEDQTQTPWPVLGAFSSEHFEPEKWRPAFPYFPFFETTPEDAFWAAKIIQRFDRPLLEALVATGGWDEAPSAYLVDALLERGRRIGVAYIDNLTPLDAFTVENGEVCAYDLAVHHGLRSGGVIERLDPDDGVAETLAVAADGEVCWDLAGKNYEVMRLRARDAEGARPTMEVHIGGRTQPRVLGIIRVAR